MRKRSMTAKRILLCLVSAVCLFGVLLSAQAQTPETTEENETVQTVCYASIIRNRAKTSSADIGSMEDGTAVTILGEEGSFYRIDCYDMEGYIAKSQVREEDGTFVIACDPASSETETITYTPHAEALELRHSLLNLAREQLGKPYIYGSMGTKGFDCSGLTSYLYKNHGTTLQRRASQQLADGIVVAREGMQVGDLIFFRTPWETSLTSHVGIYAGDNKMIHAGNGGVACVELTGEYFDGYFLCARRVINTELTQQTGTVARRSVLPAGGISGRRASENG